MAQALPQAQSRLLSLLGELRNTIYNYVFDDGKATNLNLLLACRMVYNETGTVAFSTITYRVNDCLADQSHGEKHLRLVPLPHRNAFTSVIYRESPSVDFKWRDYSRVPSICHPHGILPIEATQVAASVLLSSGVHMSMLFASCSDLLVPFQVGLFTHNRQFIVPLLGQWLQNPRLRTWCLYVQRAHHTYPGYRIVATRLDQDGTVMKNDQRLAELMLQQPLAVLSDTTGWLREHEVIMVEGFNF